MGTIWSAFLADLRLWALAIGAVAVIAGRGDRARAPRRLAADPDGQRCRLPGSGCGSPGRSALILLAVLLLWMPEVPLDLALVLAAGLLVFSGAAEVVRSAQRSLIR